MVEEIFENWYSKRLQIDSILLLSDDDSLHNVLLLQDDHACNLPSSTSSTCRSDKLVVNNISGIKNIMLVSTILKIRHEFFLKITFLIFQYIPVHHQDFPVQIFSSTQKGSFPVHFPVQFYLSSTALFQNSSTFQYIVE